VSDQKPDREALATAKGLTEALEAMTGELSRLQAYGKRNRHLIWATIISIALDLALTVVLVFAYSTANSAREAATAQHASLLAACAAGNQSRAEQVQLWDHLGAISKPAPGSTKAQVARQKAQIAAFLAYVRHVFASRDCTKIYGKP
jgi:DNA-binding GntR family transcriptional regulator